MAWYRYRDVDIYPMVRIVCVAAGAGPTRAVTHTLCTLDSDRISYIAGNQSDKPSWMTGMETDFIRIPMGSGSSTGALFNTGVDGKIHYSYIPCSTLSTTNLRGRTIAYPSSWNAASITAVESLIQPSVIFSANYGRGLYLGAITQRMIMPVFVPGSGMPLNLVMGLLSTHLADVNDQAPEPFPSAPGAPVFASTNKRWLLYDHGGPVAYVFYSLLINPSADDYHGQGVVQVSGGPTMGVGVSGATFSPDVPDGTAIDSFWPIRRVLISKD
jgi:hypothetical protein